MAFQLEELDPRRHERKDFDCGQPALNRYLRQIARQNQRAGAANCFVLIDTDNGRIAGYYTLTQHAIAPPGAGQSLFRRQKKLDRKNHVPVTLLGRLAVDQHYQGRGLGDALLGSALEKALMAADVVASAAVVVDPVDETATAFYSARGFKLLNTQSRRMFMSMQDIRASYASGNR